jgi:cytochrome c oxidase subunit 2
MQRKIPIAGRLAILTVAHSSWVAAAETSSPFSSPTSVFVPAATPAQTIVDLSVLVLTIAAGIFLVVASLLAYAVVKFRRKRADALREPTQVYGSLQLEMAWTIIPVLIVVVLFLAAGRVIADIQKAELPESAIEVSVIGHQFWWEYRYPRLGVVTANELHIPVSSAGRPAPTVLTLMSADTDHSFWVPRLAGKMDLIPNHVNTLWMDPRETGVFLGQCAQYCGTQHAKMLLRVYVDSREEFDRWIERQRQLAQVPAASAAGRLVFERTACINCHTVAGTAARGTFGPDLTHLMSRDTIASGAAANGHDNLRRWIRDPDSIKRGSKMPAMGLNDQELDVVTSYLESLR